MVPAVAAATADALARRFGRARSTKRRYDFAAGRRLARSLLGANLVLLPDEDRAPRWPEGIDGSIAHSGTVCVVAVGEGVRGIGVDVEIDTPLKPETESMILRPSEIAALGEGDRGASGKRIFCAKEAFFKAQWPMTKRWLDFVDAEVRLEDGGFTITPVVDVPPAIEGTHEGFFLRADGYVFAGLRLEP